MVQRAGGLEYAVDQVFFFKKKLFGVSVSVSVPVSVSVSVHYVCVEVVEGRKTKVVATGAWWGVETVEELRENINSDIRQHTRHHTDTPVAEIRESINSDYC